MYCVRDTSGAKKTHTPKIRGVLIERKIIKKSPRKKKLHRNTTGKDIT